MARFVAGQTGVMVVSRKPNYSVGDTEPGLGSDGRVSDHDSLEEAKADAARRNALWAADVAARADGRVWRKIPGGAGGAFAWLTPLRPLSELSCD